MDRLPALSPTATDGDRPTAARDRTGAEEILAVLDRLPQPAGRS